MRDEEILREFVSLPPEGQRRVIEFIAFLHGRYGASHLAKVRRILI